MVDPARCHRKARKAVTERADLPGMSLMEHLQELRKRIVHSAAYLAVGFCVAYAFHEKLYAGPGPPRQAGHRAQLHPPHGPAESLPEGGSDRRSDSGFALHPLPGLALHRPGLYQKERRFVIPFMSATVGLFLLGAAFGYFYVLPGALKILIINFGSKFNPVVTIEEYTGFFLSIILGLGVSFELPILIFFLAMFGLVSPRFL